VEDRAGWRSPAWCAPVSVLERDHRAHGGVFDAGEEPPDERDSRLPLLRLVVRWNRVETQLRRCQKLASPRLLRATATAEIRGDGEKPAAKSGRILELRQRRQRSQERVLGQLERPLPITVARQQAISHHASMMPVEERMLRGAVPSRGAAHQVGFVGFHTG